MTKSGFVHKETKRQMVNKINPSSQMQLPVTEHFPCCSLFTMKAVRQASIFIYFI